jgi:glycosyltransferase involved in cell wall biosynthesis
MSRKQGISVCFIIKNGVTQGYPFWESLESCLDFADEVVISEGNSTDGTAEYIRKFISKYNGKTSFRMYTDDWNEFPTSHGEVIAKVTERNMRRCGYEWIYYLQADEVLHPMNSDFVRTFAKNDEGCNSVTFQFYHFINSWTPVPLGGAAYDYAIRMVRNRPDIIPVGDAWTFGGLVEPTCHHSRVPKPIYHLGWVFPENIDMKHVEHAKLYPNMKSYVDGANIAKGRMERGEYNPMPRSETFNDYPESIERLFGMVQYRLPEEAMV